MIFSWLRARRRKKLLARPFPQDWQAIIERNLAHYRYLSGDEQAKLRNDTRIFVAEKNWEGCNGLDVTDEMRVTIAAHASLMTLGIVSEPFGGLLSVLIYPAGYRVPEDRWQSGLAIHGESARLGESWYRGPVILSWDEIQDDAQHPGYGNNLVWHEFAHQIDMLDRSTNGTPPLETPQARRQWHEVMTAEYAQLRRDAGAGRETLLDTYGAENEAEFFAVTTECFTHWSNCGKPIRGCTSFWPATTDRIRRRGLRARQPDYKSWIPSDADAESLQTSDLSITRFGLCGS